MDTNLETEPVPSGWREQIVGTARSHFRQYGYGKTTVADLAPAIGISNAYVYKFFSSKRSIGQAVCGRCLGEVRAELRRAAAEPTSAANRLRATYRILVRQSATLLFNDRRLHDIVSTAVHERWNVADAYEADVLDLFARLGDEEPRRRRVRAQDAAGGNLPRHPADYGAVHAPRAA